MEDFMFTVPQNIVFGKGSLRKLPSLLADRKLKKVLLVSDPFLKQSGLADKVAGLLREAGIDSECFSEVEPNPSTQTVDKAAEYYKAVGAEGIVVIGGGSPMDVAKAVGVLVTYGGKITEYEGGGKVPGKIVPLIAIPTTAGTGSEVTAFSVITDTSRNYKLTVFSYNIIPEYAILDPELLTTVPAGLAASCGIDALIHAVEAYTSTAANTFSDAMAEKAMELIGRSIRRFVANRKDIDAASDMMLGSTYAGIAFAWARLGDCHAMSHPVSAFWHVAHGVSNAILMPVVLEYNALADEGRYETIYDYIARNPSDPDSFVPEMLVEEFRDLCSSLGIPSRLSDVGVTDEHFDAMADDAMKSGNIAVNPRQTTKKDIIAMYYQAL